MDELDNNALYELKKLQKMVKRFKDRLHSNPKMLDKLRMQLCYHQSARGWQRTKDHYLNLQRLAQEAQQLEQEAQQEMYINESMANIFGPAAAVNGNNQWHSEPTVMAPNDIPKTIEEAQCVQIPVAQQPSSVESNSTSSPAEDDLMDFIDKMFVGDGQQANSLSNAMEIYDVPSTINETHRLTVTIAQQPSSVKRNNTGPSVEDDLMDVIDELLAFVDAPPGSQAVPAAVSATTTDSIETMWNQWNL